MPDTGLASPSSTDSNCRSASISFSSIDSPSPLSFCCNVSFQISPKPPHSSHQPWGELNENSRGSSSSKARPQPGQLISVLMTVRRFFASSRCAVPRPISSARWTRLRAFKMRLASITPTTTSIVCSLKRSSFAELRDRDELAIDIERLESLSLRPTRDLGVKTLARFHQRREHLERPALRAPFPLASRSRRGSAFPPADRSRDKIASRSWRRAAGGNGKPPSPWRRSICRRRA